MTAATAKVPGTCGGWGGGLPTTLDDLVLLRRAINEDWPIPPNVRQAIVAELADDICLSNVRRVLSTIHTFVAMDRANQRLFSRLIACSGDDSPRQ